MVEIAKGKIKVSYNDFLKIVHKSYPKTEAVIINSNDISKMINEFKVLNDIDSGSYGQVKLATNTKTGQTVALKLIDSEKIISNNKQVHINREQDLLFSLKHQHIIKIYKTFVHVSK